jgi:transcriptional regulator with XRE-family HTH domain
VSVEPRAFGPLLRQHRVAAGLTQEALAEQTGLGVRSIQHLEGGAHLPQRETVDRLARALGLTGEEQRRFEEAARPAPRRQGAAIAHPVSPDDRRRHNLPIALTSFVGREHETVEIKTLLATHRLVTLTGTGGCGKSRLALEVAQRQVANDLDGVWLIELAPLSDPTLVGQAIASALGLRETPGKPITQTLIEHLRTKETLLVVD